MGFKIVTADELIAMLKKGGYKYKWSQIHHTWRPNHSNFNGKNHLALQQGMYDYHVHVRGWNDIGQHVTLMPDGLFVTGRSFGSSPAGISGYNTGSFMVEMLGDFDKGKDKLEGAQLEAMLKLQHYLTTQAGAKIMFHREHAPKTCPGTGLDKDWFCEAVKKCDPDTPVKVSKPKTQVASDTVVNYLNLGDSNASVKALQEKLISLGYNLPKYGADGSFGQETDVAVKQFQKDHGLTADGIVGPATSKALGSAKPKVVSKPEPTKKPTILRAGMSGEEVKQLQKKLNQFGFPAGQVDGKYGSQTETAVRQFQSRVGLSVDGIAGPNTLAAIDNYNPPKYTGLLREGSKGDGVKLLQKALGVAADGIFGPDTEKALKNFQRKNGLAADGLAGPRTWNKLF